jgi:hypothetical protein
MLETKTEELGKKGATITHLAGSIYAVDDEVGQEWIAAEIAVDADAPAPPSPAPVTETPSPEAVKLSKVPTWRLKEIGAEIGITEADLELRLERTVRKSDWARALANSGVNLSRFGVLDEDPVEPVLMQEPAPEPAPEEEVK